MISTAIYFTLIGLLLSGIGLYALIVYPNLLRKILAANVMSSGIYLVYVSLAFRTVGDIPDPVPHAMVLTGIVVSVCTTALALAITKRIYQSTGRVEFPGEQTEKQDTE